MYTHNCIMHNMYLIFHCIAVFFPSLKGLLCHGWYYWGSFFSHQNSSTNNHVPLCVTEKVCLFVFSLRKMSLNLEILGLLSEKKRTIWRNISIIIVDHIIYSISTYIYLYRKVWFILFYFFFLKTHMSTMIWVCLFFWTVVNR